MSDVVYPSTTHRNPTVDDRGVDIAVEVQPRGDPPHPLPRRAVMSTRDSIGHGVGEQKVQLAVLQRVGDLAGEGPTATPPRPV